MCSFRILKIWILLHCIQLSNHDLWDQCIFDNLVSNRSVCDMVAIYWATESRRRFHFTVADKNILRHVWCMPFYVMHWQLHTDTKYLNIELKQPKSKTNTFMSQRLCTVHDELYGGYFLKKSTRVMLRLGLVMDEIHCTYVTRHIGCLMDYRNRSERFIFDHDEHTTPPYTDSSLCVWCGYTNPLHPILRGLTLAWYFYDNISI